MVDIQHPDLARFPRFAEALDAAEIAELEPATRSTCQACGGMASSAATLGARSPELIATLKATLAEPLKR